MRINLPPKLESECSQVSVEITKNRRRKMEEKKQENKMKVILLVLAIRPGTDGFMAGT